MRNPSARNGETTALRSIPGYTALVRLINEHGSDALALVNIRSRLDESGWVMMGLDIDSVPSDLRMRARNYNGLAQSVEGHTEVPAWHTG